MPKTNEHSVTSRSIRTSIFIDRSNIFLEKAFFHLSTIPKKEHPDFIRKLIFNHLTNGKTTITLPSLAPSDIVGKTYCGFSVVVAFGHKEYGFGDINTMLGNTRSNEERRSIVSKLFFTALLSASGFIKNESEVNEVKNIEGNNANVISKKPPLKTIFNL